MPAITAPRIARFVADVHGARTHATR